MPILFLLVMDDSSYCINNGKFGVSKNTLHYKHNMNDFIFIINVVMLHII